jgi:hypothetical protein
VKLKDQTVNDDGTPKYKIAYVLFGDVQSAQ